MPAFVNSPAQVMPGYGSPSCNGSVFGFVFTTASANTMTIPATGATTPAGGTPFNPSGMPAPSKGKFRFRTSTVGVAVTTSFVVTVTDGTTTEQVHAGTAVAGVALDYTAEFETDLSITSVSCVATIANAGVATGDFAVSLV
jgi:hypothetical protein